MIKDVLQKEDWMVTVDLKDAYLHVYTHHGRSMEITKVQVAGPNIRIPLSSTQAQHHVSRRHDADGSVTPETDIPIADTPADTSVAGLQDKLGKVLSRANTGDTISRTDSKLGSMKLALPPEK